jgi:hypothetical protein
MNSEKLKKLLLEPTTMSDFSQELQEEIDRDGIAMVRKVGLARIIETTSIDAVDQYKEYLLKEFFNE